jgi:hypothetical protein
MVPTSSSEKLIDFQRAKQRYTAEDRTPSVALLFVLHKMLLNDQFKKK